MIKNSLEMGWKNYKFIDEINKSIILKDYTANMLEYETNTITGEWRNFEGLFVYVLEKIIYLLQENSIDQAYDLVDAFHWLPESVAKKTKIRYIDFFTIQLIPLSEKWNIPLADDILNLLPINRFTRAILQSKIRKAKKYLLSPKQQ